MDKKITLPLKHDESVFSVKDAILDLFSGRFDNSTKYSTKIYRNQKEIASAIAKATENKFSPTQSAISKQMGKLCDVGLERERETFVIHKAADGYKRMRPIDSFEESCKQLLDNFIPTDIFYNDVTIPTEYTFRVRQLSELKNVKRQLNSIFKECLFTIAILEEEDSDESDADTAQSRRKDRSVLISVKLCPLSDTFIKTSKDFLKYLTQYFQDLKK